MENFKVGDVVRYKGKMINNIVCLKDRLAKVIRISKKLEIIKCQLFEKVTNKTLTQTFKANKYELTKIGQVDKKGNIIFK